MKLYLLSLGAGLLVGIAYSLMGVRSPAPPVVALVGLLGILLGEQLVPRTRAWFAARPAATSVQASPTRQVAERTPTNSDPNTRTR